MYYYYIAYVVIGHAFLCDFSDGAAVGHGDHLSVVWL